jgi:cytidine deaminase
VTTLPQTDERYADLIEAAKLARTFARADHSCFKVGSALLGQSGKIYTGCNIETVTFTSTCAERVALLKAISEGESEYTCIAIVADTNRLTPPCGTCRQHLWEFCGDLPVILANLNGDRLYFQMSALLPVPFDKSLIADQCNTHE